MVETNGLTVGKFVRLGESSNFGNDTHAMLLVPIIGIQRVKPTQIGSKTLEMTLKLLEELKREHGATGVDMGQFEVVDSRINLSRFSSGFLWPDLNTKDGIEARRISLEFFNR